MRTLLLLILLLTTISNANEIFVNSSAEITSALSNIQPGDTLSMVDGEWQDQRIVFSGNGTEENPILLRAQTPGKVILSGTSNLRITGTYLIVDGLYFINGHSPSGGVIEFRGGSHAENCRLTKLRPETPDQPTSVTFTKV